jgi:hypothetical protein
MRTHFALGAHAFRTGREGQVIITARRIDAQRGESLRMRRTWYADPPAGEGTPPATPPAAQSAPPTPASAPGQQPAGDKDEPEFGTPEWVKENPDGAYKALQKLRDKEAKERIEARDFKKLEAELEKFRNAEKEANDKKLREDGKLDELVKKAQTERDEALKKAQEAELKATRISIAAEFKLTPTQAKRLQGSTEEELRKDAEEMVKEFGLDKQSQTQQPTQQPDPKKQTQTTVAPGGQKVAETDDERRARLYQRGPQDTPLFNKPK